jgi:hypothetical protein
LSTLFANLFKLPRLFTLNQAFDWLTRVALFCKQCLLFHIETDNQPWWLLYIRSSYPARRVIRNKRVTDFRAFSILKKNAARELKALLGAESSILKVASELHSRPVHNAESSYNTLRSVGFDSLRKFSESQKSLSTSKQK